MSMPELTSDMGDFAGMSPKKVAAIAILRLYEKYFDYMASGGDNLNIERMTAALIICCPEKKKREEIWKTYLEKRDEEDGNKVTASVYAIGDWYEYMSDAMGLNEKNTMGG